ncbi:Uncharacterised protein [Escherichia coli]|uniref:Uncharacterized protein n=1 Tax=Escherichia coli TaxID=562 RepID=A0A376L575_ECOLX|nr:Uncharacterised protein [Escherichia coli]
MKVPLRKNTPVHGYTSSHGGSRLTFLRHQWKEAMSSPDKNPPRDTYNNGLTCHHS